MNSVLFRDEWWCVFNCPFRFVVWARKMKNHYLYNIIYYLFIRSDLRSCLRVYIEVTYTNFIRQKKPIYAHTERKKSNDVLLYRFVNLSQTVWSCFKVRIQYFWTILLRRIITSNYFLEFLNVKDIFYITSRAPYYYYY